MDKQQTAQNVADKLFATERSIDDAMIHASQLIEAMVNARRELKISSTVGEVAQTRTAETIAALSEARRSIMATHAALANLQKRMDPTVAGIVDGNKDQTAAEIKEDSHLRVAS
jgi:hypothetical protein